MMICIDVVLMLYLRCLMLYQKCINLIFLYCMNVIFLPQPLSPFNQWSLVAQIRVEGSTSTLASPPFVYQVHIEPSQTSPCALTYLTLKHHSHPICLSSTWYDKYTLAAFHQPSFPPAHAHLLANTCLIMHASIMLISCLHDACLIKH